MYICIHVVERFHYNQVKIRGEKSDFLCSWVVVCDNVTAVSPFLISTVPAQSAVLVWKFKYFSTFSSKWTCLI